MIQIDPWRTKRERYLSDGKSGHWNSEEGRGRDREKEIGGYLAFVALSDFVDLSGELSNDESPKFSGIGGPV